MLLCGWVGGGGGGGMVALEQSPTIHFDYRCVLTKVGSNLTSIFKRFFKIPNDVFGKQSNMF